MAEGRAASRRASPAPIPGRSEHRRTARPCALPTRRSLGIHQQPGAAAAAGRRGHHQPLVVGRGKGRRRLHDASGTSSRKSIAPPSDRNATARRTCRAHPVRPAAESAGRSPGAPLRRDPDARCRGGTPLEEDAVAGRVRSKIAAVSSGRSRFGEKAPPGPVDAAAVSTSRCQGLVERPIDRELDRYVPVGRAAVAGVPAAIVGVNAERIHLR